MFRGRFTFTNEEPAPTQQYQQQQWQGGQMQPYVNQSNVPVVFNSRHPVQQHHQAGDERYVRTVSFTETSTNDAGVSLQKAANRHSDPTNNTLLNLVVGGVFGLVALKLLGELVHGFGLGLGVVAAAIFGYNMLRGQIVPPGQKGGGNGPR